MAQGLCLFKAGNLLTNGFIFFGRFRGGGLEIYDALLDTWAKGLSVLQMTHFLQSTLPDLFSNRATIWLAQHSYMNNAVPFP